MPPNSTLKQSVSLSLTHSTSTTPAAAAAAHDVHIGAQVSEGVALAHDLAHIALVLGEPVHALLARLPGDPASGTP